MDAKTIAKHFGLPRADDDYQQEPSADYMRGFKAGREQGMREAAGIVRSHISKWDEPSDIDRYIVVSDAILAAIGEGK